MKLFLTSYRVPSPKSLFELVGKRPEDIRAAIIPNAKDYYAQRARDFKINETRLYLESLGLTCGVVDLRECSSEKQLEVRLKAYDMLWVSGGNTFCLRHAMKASGFEKIIKDVLTSGLVYCGESAGAIVAGKSLRGVELADEPAFAESVIDKGLGLIPLYISPHADNSVFASSVAEVRGLFGNDPNYKEINDDQCLVIDGEEMQMLNKSA